MCKRLCLVRLMTFFLLGCLTASAFTAPKAKTHKVIWTAVFSDITPLNQTVSKEYCLSHTPSVIVTTISQITSQQGVKGLNGVTIRYLSYKTHEKDHLFFNIVNAVVSGKDKQGKVWHAPMKLYEQTLSNTGVTNTVWSTSMCKGKFLGTPTVI